MIKDLTCKNLSFEIDNKKILENISFELNAGDRLVVFGPNGSGKSHLLKSLSGLLSGFNNSIWLNQKKYDEFSINEKSQLVSWLPQNQNVFFNYTLLQMVEIGLYGSIASKQNQKLKNYALEYLRVFGLQGLAQQEILKLSGGELRLGMIARTLARDASLILLDEPEAGLDVAYRQQILKLILAEKYAKNIVIFAAHDLNWGLQMGTHFLFLKQGKIISFGRKSECATIDNFNECFGIDSTFVDSPVGKQIVFGVG